MVSASREISAGAGEIFELIADPAQQPRWDGNDNLSEAPVGQRVRAVGDVFTMTLTGGQVRENHVVEFDEGLRIAWRPAEPGQEPPGHLWRWKLEPLPDGRTRVTHTYDWTELHDEERMVRARATTAEWLQASVDRLAELADRYEGRLDADDVEGRAAQLAAALADDGYAASVRPVPGTSAVQLCQGHCPVQHVAEEFPQLCEAETEAFSRLLGTPVQRLATIAHGDGICIESRLPGRPLDTSPSTTAATTAGRLLRHLHQLPAPGYGRLTEEGTRAKHATLTDWLTDITGDDDLENRILDRIHHHSRRLHCDAPRLLHGDWSPRHVLTEHHQVTGIIDLESLRGGDPIADLAGWTLEAPQPLTEALICGYAPQGLNPRDQYALTVYRLRAAIALRRWRLAENDHQKTEQIETQIATDLKTLDRSDGSPTASV